jgi:hypothetical protein
MRKNCCGQLQGAICEAPNFHFTSSSLQFIKKLCLKFISGDSDTLKLLHLDYVSCYRRTEQTKRHRGTPTDRRHTWQGRHIKSIIKTMQDAFRYEEYWEINHFLSGAVIRVPDCRSRGLGFDSRCYQIFWQEVVDLELAPLSLVSISEALH